MTCAVLAVAMVAAGCDGALPGRCEDESCGQQAWWRTTFQQSVNRQVDVLVVVDDTPAIAPFAATLATGLPQLGGALGVNPGSPMSLHVGVIRAGGCDQSTRGAACGIATGEQFLRAEWCETQTNFPGALADGLACAGALGGVNCGPAQPLKVALDALSAPPRAGWEGFLRPDADLMVIVIAGGDDASPQSALELARSIRSLKPDPYQVRASAIAPASCADGQPARLTDFVEQFGSNGALVDMCAGAFGGAAQQITATLNYALYPPCLKKVRDVDPATPGLQADCIFEDHLRAPDGTWTTARLPSCDAVAMPPCVRITPGGGPWCGDGQGYALSIERATDWCQEAGTNVTIECLSCADANDPACVPAR